MTQFLSYKYQPLIDLFETDSIDLKNQKDYIPFGDDNLLPQQIVQLSRQVAVHRAILNSKAFFITGNGFASENPETKNWIEKNFPNTFEEIYLTNYNPDNTQFLNFGFQSSFLNLACKS